MKSLILIITILSAQLTYASNHVMVEHEELESSCHQGYTSLALRRVERHTINFLEEKLGVLPEDIVRIQTKDSKHFISRAQLLMNGALSPVVAGVAIFEGTEDIKDHFKMLKCGNIKSKVTVEFYKDRELCTVNLKAKIKEGLLDPSRHAHDAQIKQKYAPTCN